MSVSQTQADAMNEIERDPARLFAIPAVELERRSDGTLILRSPQPLQSYSRCVGDWLVEWASKTPQNIFLAERNASANWSCVTYAEALQRVSRIGAWLMRQDLSVERPVVILSDNSVSHALLALAAMHIGIPVVPVSTAYCLVSIDFGKLKSIIKDTQPGVIYVGDAAAFAPAIEAVRSIFTGKIVVPDGHNAIDSSIPFSTLLVNPDADSVAWAFAKVGPDTIAKLLFTSGSTGPPKGVVNTQRMLCSNQQQILQVWPFTARTPPVLVDWLPWNHTFGGNYDFNLVLRAGGSLYIDQGKPAPRLFGKTVENLRSISPTIYFNVPRGYDMLISALRTDSELRRNFFRRLQVLFYAAAALPQHLWDALDTLARDATGRGVVIVGAWGSTETAPLATSCHFRATKSGVIGLPVPGCELKLLPRGPKLEVRVRGPNVTPAYWKQPALTARSFDEEGFYMMGDAVRLVEASCPEAGLYFDGRVAEDFKLTTGTWVNASALRVKALSALGLIAQDVVVTGHDRDEIGLLIFPNFIECRRLCEENSNEHAAESLVKQAGIRDRVRIALSMLRRDGTGSSTFASRALLMIEPPSVDAGEITDKAYINQNTVLSRRSQLVAILYADSDEVIHVQ